MQMRHHISLIVLISLTHNHIDAKTFNELIAEKKELPRLIITDKVVPLSFFSITSLDGIENVPNIEQARVIILAGNKIRRIKTGAFKSPKFKNLQFLDLGNNLISEIEDGAFEGLENLKVLFLNDNKIRSLPKDSLRGMPQLRYVSFGNNPGKNALYDQARHQLPTKTVVYTHPITKTLMIRIVGILVLAATTVAALYSLYNVTKVPVRQPRVIEGPMPEDNGDNPGTLPLGPL